MVVGSGDREEQHVYLETVIAVITVGSGDREEQHIYLETVVQWLSLIDRFSVQVEYNTDIISCQLGTCYCHAMAAHLARNLNKWKFKNNFMNTSPGIHVQVLQPSLPLAPNTYLDLHVIIHSLVPVHVDCLCCTVYVTCCFWCCGCTTYVTCCFWGFGFTTCTVCASEKYNRLLLTGRTRKCILLPS